MNLINEKSIRRTALTLMAERISIGGRPKFTRVSSEFIKEIQAEVLLLLKRKIKTHPTLGSTL